MMMGKMTAKDVRGERGVATYHGLPPLPLHKVNGVTEG